MGLCGSRKTIIPVLTFNGIISDGSSLSFKKQCKLIETAFKTPFIKTLAVVINSPGGSPVQSELIFKRVRALAEENEVQILVFIQDVAASGGYYLALCGDDIYASNSSIVGSIGVISSGFGFHELIKKHGIERRIYAQGQNKAMLDPFLPQKDSDVDILNDISKDIHDEFIEFVKTRRSPKLNLDEPDLCSGKVWSGKKAKELGLVDGIGDIHSVLHKKYGKNFELKYITEPKSFLSSIRKAIGIETIADSVVQSIYTKIVGSEEPVKMQMY